MAAGSPRLGAFCAAVAATAAVEVGLYYALAFRLGPTLALLGVFRLIQVGLVIWVVLALDGPAALGLSRERMKAGLRTGLTWSAVFGLAAFLSFVGLAFLGFSPWVWLRTTFPSSPVDLILYFVVGALVAPLAEEAFFRGLIFGYFRRFGLIVGLLVSAVVFVMAHLPQNEAPVTQAAGGLIFALAYERSKSLVAPIVIHSLGNSAIFIICFIAQESPFA